MKTIDTRDLYTLQQELQSLKEAVGDAEKELQEAQDALAAHDTADNRISHFDWAGGQKELQNAVDEAQSALDNAMAAFGEDEQAELEELDNLESEISEWRHGETMILESDFEDYARQFAGDIGAIPDDARWPCTCIDWEKAAEELSQDYSIVSYQGDDYYVRS